MILTADIGNTNVALGVFDGDRLIHKTSLPDRIDYLSGEWRSAFLTALEGIDSEKIEGAVLASVVPELTDTVYEALGTFIKGRIIKAEPSRIKAVNVPFYDKSTLGADRLADITAAVKLYGAPAAVFDLGTATTFSAADRDGNFAGGMIIPGVRLSLDALSSRASLLPFTELKEPASFLGNDTVSCMVNGAVYGAAAIIDGLSERLKDKYGSDVSIIVTGGAAPVVLPFCRNKVIYDEDLLLKGLDILYYMNT